MSNDEFPANSVLDWYMEAEKMLAGFLDYVPYCDTHKEIWSPKLVIVLQETCSQLDSLWRWGAVNVHGKKANDVGIQNYFELYGFQVAPRWVIFWADKPEKVEPFRGWQESQCHHLDWWTEGYNKVKHNRLKNRTCATLKRTVEALAGLFLAIICSENCWRSLWEKHWLVTCDAGMIRNPFASLRAEFEPTDNKGKYAMQPMAAESRLFAYRIARCERLVEELKRCPYQQGGYSRRYQAWCASHPGDFRSANGADV